jgi:hypothetical protein
MAQKLRKIGLAGIVSLAATAGVAAAGTPAFATNSRIDIGYTVFSGGYIRGSGSTTNYGDYTNVCVVIMSHKLNGIGNPSQNESQACISSTGYHNWSAPSVQVTGTGTDCWRYWTRISAYVNGNRVANKDSNNVDLGNCG